MPAISLKELEQFCHQYLNASSFKDYCPNGLQIEGKPHVHKVVGGVTASMALIEKAIEAKADALLVHHGYFWKGEPEALTGMKGRRIKKLMQHDLSLLAYHLPLDAHPSIGNNASLIKQLDLPVKEISSAPDNPLLQMISLAEPITPDALNQKIKDKLGREPLWIMAQKNLVYKIAICTGAAQSMLIEAAVQGCDAFISGEISEKTVHEAAEENIHYFASGHHATEKGGIQNLGKVLEAQLGIEFEFIDIPSPV